ncbi:hypothetical protein OS493_021414 [Desmophyllum pertusum]|uniref:Uncharacterized protein n=1 Tax=Desmophyllum pertusum TaxID=174260 RepID=A0A9W9YYK5_9CNID|nr:hypothetical protein OS493_021414 [Desmophyllum pertusum]
MTTAFTRMVGMIVSEITQIAAIRLLYVSSVRSLSLGAVALEGPEDPIRWLRALVAKTIALGSWAEKCSSDSLLRDGWTFLTCSTRTLSLTPYVNKTATVREETSGGFFRTVFVFPILFNPPLTDASIIVWQEKGMVAEILSCFMQPGTAARSGVQRLPQAVLYKLQKSVTVS